MHHKCCRLILLYVVLVTQLVPGQLLHNHFERGWEIFYWGECLYFFKDLMFFLLMDLKLHHIFLLYERNWHHPASLSPVSHLKNKDIYQIPGNVSFGRSCILSLNWKYMGFKGATKIQINRWVFVNYILETRK